jgi:hypothetical protein
MAMKLTAFSLALAIGAAIFLLAFPFYSGFDGIRTLVDANGPWVLIPILLPVLAAAVPFGFRRRIMRVISSVVFVAFVLISGFTIGLCYLPAAIAMIAAASQRGHKHRRGYGNQPPPPTPKSRAAMSVPSTSGARGPHLLQRRTLVED